MRLSQRAHARAAGVIILACWTGPPGIIHAARAAAPTLVADADDGDLARKADIMHGERWRLAVAAFGDWLTTQTVYPPAEVRRIKSQSNDRVAALSSFELEYLLDSLTAKLALLDTPEARDAKTWLGEYLFAMSDARRAAELRKVPNILDMNAARLWQEIQRIDRLRPTLEQRQQNVESRQGVLAERATAERQATAAAAQAAAARIRSAPAHSPYRQGGGSPPFSDVQRQPPLLGIGFFGGFLGFRWFGGATRAAGNRIARVWQRPGRLGCERVRRPCGAQTSTVHQETEAVATRAWTEGRIVYVELTDQRVMEFPADRFRRLQEASAGELAEVRLEVGGTVLRWESLDERISSRAWWREGSGCPRAGTDSPLTATAVAGDKKLPE